MTWTRRRFLQTVAAGGVLVLGLERLGPSEPGSPGAPMAAETTPYRDWRDVYRESWRWDRIACGTHTNANCVASCAWNLYVRDGLVWREEQTARYPASNASVPDWNPRGCQKGACYSALAHGPARVIHPLRRVGARGEGRWKRISWQEALDEIADHLVEALARRGGEGVLCELGGHIDYGAATAAAYRFFSQLGAPITDVAAENGDLPVGGTITLGLPFTGGSADDWFRSDFLVLWAFNPAVTRIPDAHFVQEARYRGARVVSISPDYGPSTIHSDLWISPRPGTDAALALAACQVILEEGLHRPEYLREQTDLALLVREDTRRFLREADVVEGGSRERFAWWNERTERLVWAPGCAGSRTPSLRIPGGVRPALEGAAELVLLSGERVRVRPVLSILRERLETIRPERAAEITGVTAGTIRRFARELASARTALVLSQFGACKNYHSDLIQRSQILLASLTGNLGREGGGWHSGGNVALDALALFGIQDKLDLARLAWIALQSWRDPEALMSRFESLFVSGTLFHAVHGGIGDEQTAAAQGDPDLAEGAAPYLAEALAARPEVIGLAAGEPPPEVIVSLFGDVLRHSKRGERIREHLFAGARLLVDINFRWSETGRHADIVLPAAGWYEKVGLKYVPVHVPFVTLGDRAVPPLGESKPEWEIFSLLAARVAERARHAGLTQVRGFRGNGCDIAHLDERFSDGGRFGPDAEEDVTRFILRFSSASMGMSLEALREAGGALRLRGLGPQGGPAGVFSEYSPEEPFAPLREFVEDKRPYPTLTGRQQFYIDHPWFLDLGEELPVHKAPPAAGGRHPFVLTSGHARWSIHGIWRDDPLMLNLQRGEPLIYLNAAVARARGIRDHDRVRMWNDLGSVVVRVKLSGAIQPGQVHISHAWEPYQFQEGRSHQSLAPSPLKVTQLVWDYGQLRFGFARYEPNQVDRDTRVEIARLEPA